MKFDEIYENAKSTIGDTEIDDVLMFLRTKDAGLISMKGTFEQLTTALCVVARELIDVAPDPASAYAFDTTMRMVLNKENIEELIELIGMDPKGRAS